MNVQRKIQQWKDGLADLSRRNRLLHFRTDKLSTITVLTPAREIYESLIQEREPIELATLEVDHSEVELTKYLKKLRQTANSTLEEKGVNSLFIAIETLTWVEVNPNKPQDPLVSPVFLVPVELRKKPKKEEYTLHPHQEDAFFNPILVQKLKGDYGISIPEALTAAEDEESKIPNYEGFLEILRDALVGQPT